MIYTMIFKTYREKLYRRAVYLIAIASLVMFHYALGVLSQLHSYKRFFLYGSRYLVLFNWTDVVILLLTFAIVFYANRLFFRQNQRELGIMNLLGLSKLHLTLWLFIERLLLELTGLAFGLGLGLIFTKLIGMLFFKLVRIPILINIWWSNYAFWHTVVGFLLVFTIQYVVDYGQLRLLTPHALLNNAQRPVRHFKLTLWNKLMGLIAPLLWMSTLLALFRYNWLSNFTDFRLNRTDFINLIFPIAVSLAGCGSIFLIFKYTFPVAVELLRAKKKMWAGFGNLKLGKISEQLSKHYRSLFIDSLMTTLCIILFGTSAVMYNFLDSQAMEYVPLDLVMFKDANHHVTQQFRHRRMHLRRLGQVGVKMLPGALSGPHAREIMEGQSYPVSIMSEADYNRTLRYQHNLKEIKVHARQAVLISSNQVTLSAKMKTLSAYRLRLKGYANSLEIKDIRRFYPMGNMMYYSQLMVVADHVYQQLKAPIQFNLVAYSFKRRTIPSQWLFRLDDNSYRTSSLRSLYYTQGALKTAQVSFNKLSGNYHLVYANDYILRMPILIMIYQIGGILIFLTVLLALLITLSWLSVFSLRIVVDANEQWNEYFTYRRIGIEVKELRQMITTQISVLYALPFLVGLITGTSAILFFDNYLGSGNLQLFRVFLLALTGFYILGMILTTHNYQKTVFDDHQKI